MYSATSQYIECVLNWPLCPLGHQVIVFSKCSGERSTFGMLSHLRIVAHECKLPPSR